MNRKSDSFMGSNGRSSNISKRNEIQNIDPTKSENVYKVRSKSLISTEIKSPLSPIHNTRTANKSKVYNPVKIYSTKTSDSVNNKSKQPASTPSKPPAIPEPSTAIYSKSVPSKAKANDNIPAKNAVLSDMYTSQPSTSKGIKSTAQCRGRYESIENIPASEFGCNSVSYLSEEYRQRIKEKATITEEELNASLNITSKSSRVPVSKPSKTISPVSYVKPKRMQTTEEAIKAAVLASNLPEVPYNEILKDKHIFVKISSNVSLRIVIKDIEDMGGIVHKKYAKKCHFLVIMSTQIDINKYIQLAKKNNNIAMTISWISLCKEYKKFIIPNRLTKLKYIQVFTSPVVKDPFCYKKIQSKMIRKERYLKNKYRKECDKEALEEKIKAEAKKKAEEEEAELNRIIELKNAQRTPNKSSPRHLATSKRSGRLNRSIARGRPLTPLRVTSPDRYDLTERINLLVEDQYLRPGERKLYDSCSDPETEFAMDDAIYDRMVANRGSPETVQREADKLIRKRLRLSDIDIADSDEYFYGKRDYSPVKSAKRRHDFVSPSGSGEGDIAGAGKHSSTNEKVKPAQSSSATAGERKNSANDCSLSGENFTPSKKGLISSIKAQGSRARLSSCKTPQVTFKFDVDDNSTVKQSSSEMSTSTPKCRGKLFQSKPATSSIAPDVANVTNTPSNETLCRLPRESVSKPRRRSKASSPSRMVTRRTSKLLSQIPAVLQNLQSSTKSTVESSSSLNNNSKNSLVSPNLDVALEEKDDSAKKNSNTKAHPQNLVLEEKDDLAKKNSNTKAPPQNLVLEEKDDSAKKNSNTKAPPQNLVFEEKDDSAKKNSNTKAPPQNLVLEEKDDSAKNNSNTKAPPQNLVLEKKDDSAKKIINIKTSRQNNTDNEDTMKRKRRKMISASGNESAPDSYIASVKARQLQSEKEKLDKKREHSMSPSQPSLSVDVDCGISGAIDNSAIAVNASLIKNEQLSPSVDPDIVIESSTDDYLSSHVNDVNSDNVSPTARIVNNSDLVLEKKDDSAKQNSNPKAPSQKTSCSIDNNSGTITLRPESSMKRRRNVPVVLIDHDESFVPVTYDDRSCNSSAFSIKNDSCFTDHDPSTDLKEDDHLPPNQSDPNGKTANTDIDDMMERKRRKIISSLGSESALDSYIASVKARQLQSEKEKLDKEREHSMSTSEPSLFVDVDCGVSGAIDNSAIAVNASLIKNEQLSPSVDPDIVIESSTDDYLSSHFNDINSDNVSPTARIVNNSVFDINSGRLSIDEFSIKSRFNKPNKSSSIDTFAGTSSKKTIGDNQVSKQTPRKNISSHLVQKTPAKDKSSFKDTAGTSSKKINGDNQVSKQTSRKNIASTLIQKTPGKEIQKNINYRSNSATTQDNPLNADDDSDDIISLVTERPDKNQIQLHLTERNALKKGLTDTWLNQTVPSHTRLPSIVMSGMGKCEKNLTKSAIKTLGHFRLVNNTGSCTTHCVLNGNKRTMNAMHAMIRGIWLLDYTWVKDSLKAGKWLNEENYESTWFPAARSSRLEQELHSDSFYMMSIFSGKKFVIGRDVKPDTDVIARLLKYCGGKVMHRIDDTTVHIGVLPEPNDKVMAVSEEWIFDCISNNVDFSYDDYVINNYNSIRCSSPTF